MNFNSDFAQCGKVTIAEVEEIVEAGEIPPEQVHIPGVFIHRLVLGEYFEKKIERLKLSPSVSKKPKGKGKEEKKKETKKKEKKTNTKRYKNAKGKRICSMNKNENCTKSCSRNERWHVCKLRNWNSYIVTIILTKRLPS